MQTYLVDIWDRDSPADRRTALRNNVRHSHTSARRIVLSITQTMFSSTAARRRRIDGPATSGRMIRQHVESEDVYSSIISLLDQHHHHHLIIMIALWNRADHYIFMLWFLLLLLLFSSPNLSRRRLDVCHTSTHGVASVRIKNAGLKPAALGSPETQDAKKSPKSVIWAPSHNFVGLYLRN